jgi:hypothetical protein
MNTTPCNVSIRSGIQVAIDDLNKVNNEITRKLISHDVFDLEGFPKRLKKKVIEIIEKRNLKYQDDGFEAGGECFITVGLKGADFEAHEAER